MGKMEQLQKLTKNTAENIIGDVEAVSNILTTISISDKAEDQKETRDRMIIDQKVTKSILRFEKRYKGSPSTDSVDLERTFVNTPVIEVKVADTPEEFKLHLFIKLYIDIVSKDFTC